MLVDGFAEYGEFKIGDVIEIYTGNFGSELLAYVRFEVKEIENGRLTLTLEEGECLRGVMTIFEGAAVE